MWPPRFKIGDCVSPKLEHLDQFFLWREQCVSFNPNDPIEKPISGDIYMVTSVFVNQNVGEEKNTYQYLICSTYNNRVFICDESCLDKVSDEESAKRLSSIEPLNRSLSAAIEIVKHRMELFNDI